MIIHQGQRVDRPLLPRILDYLWGVCPALAALCLLASLWSAAAHVFGPLLLPEPKVVLINAWQLLETQAGWTSTLTTLTRWLTGIALALVLGIATGIVAGLSPTLRWLLRPFNTVLLGMPPIVWVVLAMFWFGLNSSTSTVFTVSITVLPLLFASAMMAMQMLPVQHLEMVKLYRLPWSAQLMHVYIPHLSTHLLPAAIVAVGNGLKITVMAELLGNDTGIGAQLANARAMLDTTTVLSYVVIIISLIMLIEYGVLEPLRRFLMPYQHARR